MSTSRPDSYTADDKEETHQSTSHVMNTLHRSHPKLPYCHRITGAGLNPHIQLRDNGAGQFLLASLRVHGISSVAQDYFKAAVKSGTGIAQTWMVHKPLFFISDPSLILQIVKFHNADLIDSEADGVQERFFGKGTIISLSKEDKEYRPLRATSMAHLFNPIALLARPMQTAMNYYLQEIANSLNREINLEDFAARAAISIISQTQLGFDNFPEEDKTELAKIVHEVVGRIPIPINTILIMMENAIRNTTGIQPNFVWHLDKLSKKGEAILKKVIALNESKVLEKLQSLTGNKNLTAKELTQPKIMSLIKLFLIGGFETTTKLLLMSMLMLSDPSNKQFVAKLREEINAQTKSPDEWETKDLDHLEYLHAFVFEVLRLYPPFSHMRHTCIKDFSIAQNLHHVKEKKEYLTAFDAPNRNTEDDIFIPKGSMIVISPFDAHRHKSIYGKDAEIFNPDRWIGKKFSLRDIMARPDFFTFGNDSRACPGRIFSEQEAMLFIARVISQFDIKSNLKIPLPLNVGFTLELGDGVKANAVFSKVDRELGVGLDEKTVHKPSRDR